MRSQGVLYMMFGAFPVIFQQERGWTSGVGGLPFMWVPSPSLQSSTLMTALSEVAWA